MPSSELPYWNFNLPHHLQTLTCPDYLLNVSEKDKRLIGSWDSDCEPMSWATVRSLVASNRIDLFQRLPSELRRYRKFIYDITQHHGSVMKFILRERLHWDSLSPSAKAPFEDAGDVKVLYNDWPYGVDPRIVHLVVWTKFELPDDPVSGDLTAEAREVIDEYVGRTFTARMKRGEDDVVWFKNWKNLKSVHAVEHFHVMLYDPDLEFVREITGGDVPLSLKLRKGGEADGVVRNGVEPNAVDGVVGGP